MSDLDERIAARPAPKVTPDDIKAVIMDAKYHKLTDTLTVCVLYLENGYTVTGQSACASPENYDQAIGEELAYKDAENKVWGLEAYLLKQAFNHHNTEGSAPSNRYNERVNKYFARG